jgi:small subunit ribosomal protein S20
VLVEPGRDPSTDPNLQMPNLKSAKKRMKLSAAARAKNRSDRARIRTAIKNVRQATDPKDAEARLREAVALLDRAATKKLFPPNRVSHMKSNLTLFVRKLAS